jgi:hypothetical protein
MTHVARISTTATDLVRIAWCETDFLGDLLPHSLYYRAHIASCIDEAADIYRDRTGAEPSDAELTQARFLLEMETNAYLERLDEERADALADARDAGDVDADGEVVPYDRYAGV